ncbi:MAG: HAD family hydrolase [Ruminococcus sp.]|nr:HAD family hydrolase [Ruminococcus sp.]
MYDRERHSQSLSTHRDKDVYGRVQVAPRFAGAAGLSHDKEVIHIGDSLSSDIEGARNAGIGAVWINRGGRNVPQGVRAVSDLLEAAAFLKT